MVTNTESPPAVTTFALGPAGTLAAGMFAPMVWYSNNSLRAAGDNAVTVAEVIPAAAKAVLSGANTVKGPVPLKVPSKPAFTTASFNTLKLALPTTTLVIVLGVGAGSSFLQDDKLINEPAIKAKKVVFAKFFITPLRVSSRS